MLLNHNILIINILAIRGGVFRKIYPHWLCIKSGDTRPKWVRCLLCVYSQTANSSEDDNF